LVPTFAGLRDPLTIPGVGPAHERKGRRVLYAAVMLALLAAFGFEATGRATLGMIVRAIVVTLMVLWVWKLYRAPRAGVPGFVLWSAGWFLALGLWGAAAIPEHAIAALHLTFIGGFALLTLGVGTRVIVSHGRRPLEVESRVLDVPVATLVIVALGLRVVAELAPERAAPALAGSAVAWGVAWIAWAYRGVTIGRTATGA